MFKLMGMFDQSLGMFNPSGRIFNPIQLFAGGVQGAWYDPSDQSTLFQDSAGTTPVTAVEQPVGLVLDKSGVPKISLAAGTSIASVSVPGGLAVSKDGLSVYVTNSSSSSITRYNRDVNTGLLTDAGTVATGAGGWDVIVSYDGTSAYSANATDNTISLFIRNTTTGALTANGTIATGTGPRALVISPDGTSVYAANYGGNSISRYTRNTSTGALTFEDTTVGITTPYRMLISSDGAFLYVISNGAGGGIYLFNRNTSTGALSANGSTSTGLTPYDAVMSADGTSVYVANYNSNTLSIYSRNTLTGALTSGGTIATSTNPIGVTIPPDGKTVYVTHFGGLAINTYSRDGATGALVASDVITAPSATRYCAFSPDGATLYVARGTAFVLYYRRFTTGNHASQSTAAKRPVLSARYNLLLATETLATQNVTTVATTYTLAFSGAGSITLSGTKTGTYTAGTNTLTGVTAGTLTLTVSGSVTQADLRPANDGIGLPAYQRVTTATDYDTVGFPLYLKFDGVDDALQTGSIDFSATDKMTVFGGARKLSDAAQGAIAELSATIASNNGTFLLTAPNSAAANYNFSSKGTTQVDNTVTTYTSPISGVLTGQGDISAPSNIIRVNGTQIGASTSSQGTGNYGNYALNIGARNAASLYFNGRIYSLIIRGAATSNAQIAQTETWINQRAKIY